LQCKSQIPLGQYVAECRLTYLILEGSQRDLARSLIWGNLNLTPLDKVHAMFSILQKVAQKWQTQQSDTLGYDPDCRTKPVGKSVAWRHSLCATPSFTTARYRGAA
jgi:hypothetical protein